MNPLQSEEYANQINFSPNSGVLRIVKEKEGKIIMSPTERIEENEGGYTPCLSAYIPSCNEGQSPVLSSNGCFQLGKHSGNSIEERIGNIYYWR